MTDLYLSGWRIRTELPLPELLPWTGDERQPDIRIRLGEVPERLDTPIYSGPFMQLGADGRVRLSFKGVSSFLVRDGCEVIVAPILPADSPDIALFLLGSVFGMLCHQRNLLPLHAACLAVNGRAVAIAGESGAGKSTLAALLARQGHALLSDDVIPVDQSGTLPMVRPAFPRQKLWADTLAHLGAQPGRRIRSVEALEKFEHMPEGDFRPAPLPLAAICHLQTRRLPGEAEAERVKGIEAMHMLHGQVYRARAAQRLGLGGRLMMDCCRLAAAVPQIVLRRPDSMAACEDFARRLPALLEALL